MKTAFICFFLLGAAAIAQTTDGADPNAPDANGFVAGAPYRIMAGKPYDLTDAIAWGKEWVSVISAVGEREPLKDSPAALQYKAAKARVAELGKLKTSFAPLEFLYDRVDTIASNGIILESGYPINKRVFIRNFPKGTVATGDMVSFLAVPDKIITNSASGEALHSYDFGLTPEQVAKAAAAAVPAP